MAGWQWCYSKELKTEELCGNTQGNSALALAAKKTKQEKKLEDNKENTKKVNVKQTQ